MVTTTSATTLEVCFTPPAASVFHWAAVTWLAYLACIFGVINCSAAALSFSCVAAVTVYALIEASVARLRTASRTLDAVCWSPAIVESRLWRNTRAPATRRAMSTRARTAVTRTCGDRVLGARAGFGAGSGSAAPHAGHQRAFADTFAWHSGHFVSAPFMRRA